MWRYCSSVKPPEQKKRKIQESQAAYEEKRQRKFQQAWLLNPEFKSWLRYDEASDLMFCKCCEKHGQKDQTFVKGCGSHRVDNLQKHAASRLHVKVMEIEAARCAAPGTSPAERMLGKINAIAMERYNLLFRNAHVLTKRNRPFTDFEWMCELDEIKGLNIGPNYRSDKKCREFTDAIGEVERQLLEDRLKSAKFLSVICDEATDSAVMEQLIIYVR